MKTVVSISLGPAGLDFDFRTRFLGKRLRVLRIGTDGDTNRAEMLLQEWQQQADAIGLGAVRDHRQVGVRKYEQAPTRRLLHPPGLVHPPHPEYPARVFQQQPHAVHEWRRQLPRGADPGRIHR